VNVETKWTSAVVLVLIVLLAGASVIFFQSGVSDSSNVNPPVHVGVSFQGNTTAEAELLIDRVKSYTNLFIVGSCPVSRDETAVTEVCDYAVAAGLDIIVNFGYYDPNAASADEAFRRWPWQHTWIEEAKPKYGSHFLGVYYDDEPGGVTLDWNWTGLFDTYSSYFTEGGNSTLQKIYAKLVAANASGTNPANYDLEAQYFADFLGLTFGPTESAPKEVLTFTSDYGLYWFDYLGGYDVILAELGWNHTATQDLTLIKGAARLQNKQWGAIITWKYEQPPYLDTGPNIYEQMVQAYEAGASYITIFDYPTLDGNPYGVMQDEHFAALEAFWKNVVTAKTPTVPDYRAADVALVLPKNYGWGMRTANDKIWGMWPADDKSPQIYALSRQLLTKYGLQLDIVYDDAAFPLAGRYSQVYYWNDSYVG
jgi:hypothetical protein